jgi:hypothetical protein
MHTSIKLVGLGFFFLLSVAFSNHKYYMSLMQINFVQEQQALQVTVRIFVDDLQTALNAVGTAAVEIATDREPLGIEKRYRAYLNKQLSFEVNNRKKKFVYLGKEYEENQVVFYLEIQGIDSLQSLRIKNTLLTHALREQKNIVKTKAYGKNKSVVLTKNKSKSLIYF